MAAIVTDIENTEVAEDATSSLDVGAVDTVRGNIQAFFAEDNASMMGGWTK
ncbi:hypothetical protein OG401_14375 [Kitasatospora purpeofusca]|uniref:hypothetical protein n=1 Tax=Kitasatospora purpeofusca TaxID=67352 RepID=UPI002259889D|nr:hypothetical protein [Kitasatospora purpeofusca]MCX4685485.1 hypothetical protein [Kitasatospora purpeofusca]